MKIYDIINIQITFQQQKKKTFQKSQNKFEQNSEKVKIPSMLLNSKYQLKVMRFFKKVEDIVKKIDFFYSKEMLRYDEDEDYKTLTGGIASVGIIIAIIIGFASMILDTLNLSSITTTTQIIKNVIPPASTLDITPESPFRFAVEVWRFNLSDTKRYFDITFRVDYQTNGVVVSSEYIPLEACTKQYFSGYPDISNSFQKLQGTGWLCPPLNTTLNLYGKYSSQSYSQYIVTASACNNNTDPSRPCASPEQIQALFDSSQNFCYFDFYFTNPQINPDQKDYKKYYFEDQSYVIFGSHMGSQTFLYFTDYTVETDYSIWPYTNVVKDQGCIVEELAINHPFETNINGTYVTFNLAKSTNSLVYTRQVQKLSAVFSFIGGMIGAVSAVLFILKIYTNIAFQFSISQQIFKQERKTPEQNQTKQPEATESAEPIENLSMNLWTFVRYYAYKISKTIGKPCNWPTIQYADECREQISKQLDIRLLLKRIIFIEHCLTNMMEDYQLDALQMSKPLSPSEIRSIREKCQSLIDNESQKQKIESQIDFKQKQNAKQLQTILKKQTPLNSPGILIQQKNQQTYSQLRQNFKFFREQLESSHQSSNEMKKLEQLVDIENARQEDYINEQLQYMKGKSPLVVANTYRISSKIARRSGYLQQLKQNALQGDKVSSRIWKKLDENIRKSVSNQSPFILDFP